MNGNMKEVQTVQATLNAQDLPLPPERLRPSSDLIEYCRQYARERPEIVALVCLGIGIVLGWKLKPW
jgi:hypothetical protein